MMRTPDVTTMSRDELQRELQFRRETEELTPAQRREAHFAVCTMGLAACRSAIARAERRREVQAKRIAFAALSTARMEVA